MPYAHQYLYSKVGPRDPYQWWSSRGDPRDGDRYRAALKDGPDLPLRMLFCKRRGDVVEVVAIARDPVESSREIRFFSALRVAVLAAEELTATSGASALWRGLDAARQAELPGDVPLALDAPTAPASAPAEAARLLADLAAQRHTSTSSLTVAGALLDRLSLAMLVDLTCVATRGDDGWTVRLALPGDHPTVDLGALDEAQVGPLLDWLHAAGASWPELSALCAPESTAEVAWSSIETAWRLEGRADAAPPAPLRAAVERARAAVADRIAHGAFPAGSATSPASPVGALYGEAIERALTEPNGVFRLMKRMADERGAALLAEACAWLEGRDGARLPLAAACGRAAILHQPVDAATWRIAIERAPVGLAPLLRDALAALVPKPSTGRASLVAALRSARTDPRVSCLAAAVERLADEPDEAMTLLEVLLSDADTSAPPPWAAELAVRIAASCDDHAAGAGDALARLHASCATAADDRVEHLSRLRRRARAAYDAHRPPTAAARSAPGMGRVADCLAGAAIGAATALTTVALTLGAPPPRPSSVASRARVACAAPGVIASATHASGVAAAASTDAAARQRSEGADDDARGPRHARPGIAHRRLAHQAR